MARSNMFKADNNQCRRANKQDFVRSGLGSEEHIACVISLQTLWQQMKASEAILSFLLHCRH